MADQSMTGQRLYANGQRLYVTHRTTSAECRRVTIISSYTERGYETIYFVRSDDDITFFVHESDLTTADPSDRWDETVDAALPAESAAALS